MLRYLNYLLFYVFQDKRYTIKKSQSIFKNMTLLLGTELWIETYLTFKKVLTKAFLINQYSWRPQVPIGQWLDFTRRSSLLRAQIFQYYLLRTQVFLHLTKKNPLFVLTSFRLYENLRKFFLTHSFMNKFL